MFTSASRDINVVLQKEPTGQPCKTMGNFLQITENERRKLLIVVYFLTMWNSLTISPAAQKKRRKKGSGCCTVVFPSFPKHNPIFSLINVHKSL